MHNETVWQTKEAQEEDREWSQNVWSFRGLDELDNELWDDSENDEGDGDEEHEEVGEKVIEEIDELLDRCEGMTPVELDEKVSNLFFSQLNMT